MDERRARADARRTTSWSMPDRRFLAERTHAASCRTGSGSGSRRAVQRPELAADVLACRPTPRCLAGSTGRCSGRSSRSVCDDRAVRVRTRRARADLIEVLAPRGLQHGLALARQVVDAADAWRPVLPERRVADRRRTSPARCSSCSVPPVLSVTFRPLITSPSGSTGSTDASAPEACPRRAPSGCRAMTFRRPMEYESWP